MTDSNANPLPRPNTPGRVAVRTSIPRSSSSYGSYDTGESSAAANRPHDTSIDSTSFRRSAVHKPPVPNPHPQSVNHGEQNLDHDTHRKRRLPKPRPSGGFLLSNNILGQSSSLGSRQRDDDRRKSRIPVDSRTGKSPLRSSEDHYPSESTGPRITPDEKESTKPPPAPVSSGTDARDNRPHSQMALRRRSMIPSLRPSSAPLDVDSNQIVSMALDLSESRRLASRRNISNPNPPRLVQLPDSIAGRSLKQHLQQQRRTSRNISPRADRILSPRIVSTPRISSPLQPAFDHDDSYTYHFSASTLDRAQRAKEYLELMAQYRRLLSFLPPLKRNTHSQPSTANPSTSPDSTGSPRDPLSTSQNQVLGRPYNPLQYIRNRKIRTRERKVIDGEAQGFGDIIKTMDWVDQVASFAAMLPTASRRPILPPFSAADEHLAQQLPASSLPRPVSTLTKPKRPRFDWSIDPADMLADVYWLEQDNNRYLIEDRHYIKIYTPETTVSQPTASELEPSLAAPAHKGNSDANDSEVPQQDINQMTNTDIDTTLSSRRDRARQKLQDLRTHHRHSYSTHSHHDFLRLRRGSSSDSSDNENDRRRRGRTGTISASGKDLLEKQMNEMLARESQDEQELASGAVNDSQLKPLPAGISAAERNPQISHFGHRRTKSHIQGTQHVGKALIDKPIQTPPLNSPRASLEIPSGPYRSSIELDSPRPPISNVMPRGRQNGYVPAIGMDLSPTVSRPSSPARKPFSKVKSIFRDRSRDREERENDDRVSSPVDLTGTLSISQVTGDTIQPIQSIQRQRSKSSTREFALRPAHESHKSHRSVGSLSLRPDEQIGIRTIFKGGAKLDDMIRGGVSKMTDLIWKKDSDSSDSSDNDSGADDRKDRPTKLALRSPGSSTRHSDSRRPVRNYMDIMSNFKSTTDSMDKVVSQKIDNSLYPVSSQPPSRSPRFDQLKPPRIDIRKASPEVSELEDDNNKCPRGFVDSTSSETDSYFHDSDRSINRPRRTSKELQNFLSINDKESSVSHMDNRTRISSHRNWVIPDRTSLSQHALISRREVARLRALILCSGIKAVEISRRANEPRFLFGSDNSMTGLQGMDLNRFMPDEKRELRIPQTQLFPATSRVLSQNIDHSIENFEKSASEFSTHTTRLQHQVDMAHNRIAVEFMDMTHRAADEADDLSHDLVDYQRLKVEDAVNTIDNMLRQRRRRFRWVRRAGWLAVEWVLVGFMWYVWFIVMITRIILGVGRGIVSVIRWLLWI
ncbi:hypothetical protein RRF57_007322 [Xylaria bambusicola]|uniref:Uncharacterized protein n=1 Tax=Xylaria bambusicola TaxID=326684 RepID=A0AAN7URU0_9PEZI